MQRHNESNDLLTGLQPSQIGERTASCPDDHRVAAWYERRLGTKEAQELEQHLPECPYCRSRVGMLARLEQDPFGESVAQDLLARAKQLASAESTRQRRRTVAWAAAAVIALGLGLGVNIGRHPSPVAPEQTADPGARQLRSREVVSSRPVILRPVAEAVLESVSLAVNWTPVEGSLHYELLLMDDAGRLLRAEPVQATEWQSDGDAGLVPGGHYFIRVNAHLADGRMQASKHTAFSVSDRQAVPESAEQ